MTQHPAFEGELPNGWTGGEPVTKYWNGDFVHLYRLTRPCNTCGAEMSIDVSKRALEGKARNAGLLLRNCPKCREERKNGGPGSRGGKSRPTVDSPNAPPADKSELERLQMMVNNLKAEVDPVYERNREMYAENQVLKARLSKYELNEATFEQALVDPPIVSSETSPWLNGDANLTNDIWKR